MPKWAKDTCQKHLSCRRYELTIKYVCTVSAAFEWRWCEAGEYLQWPHPGVQRAWRASPNKRESRLLGKTLGTLHRWLPLLLFGFLPPLGANHQGQSLVDCPF